MFSSKGCREGGGREGHLELRRLSSQVAVTCDGALLSRKRLNTCLTMGSSEYILYFALIAHIAFALPVKLSLTPPTSFLTSALLFPTPLEGSDRAAG